MHKKKRFYIFLILVILIFALLTYQGTRSGINTSGISTLNVPLVLLQQGITSVINGVKNIFQSYINLVGKEAENRKLVTEIEQQEQKYNKILEEKNENERLRSLLNLKKQRTDYVTTAGVFARDPTNWFQILWINKGSDDKVAKDMVAATPQGVVGKVHRVFDDVSSIILITDVSSSVAVRIQSSRTEGILEGRGTDKCYLKYVPLDVNIAEGDRVITSGLDGIYPKGLSIGYISSIEKNPKEFFQLISVSTAQKLHSVEEVVILKR